MFLQRRCTNLPLRILTSLPQLNQNIASYLASDKDLASFRLICKSTHDAVDADACSFWRRRFKQTFESANLKLTGRRNEDGEKYRTEYQTRKKVLHVIDPVFQMAGKLPKLQFEIGTTAKEREALRVLRDLIVGKSDLHFEHVILTYTLTLYRCFRRQEER